MNMKAESNHDAYYTYLAMAALSRFVPDSLEDAPEPVRVKFDNALLNIAVNRLVNAEGPVTAATILWRLADFIREGRVATPQHPADLSILHDAA